MKEELDKTEWKLAKIVEKLLDKYHDQYEDWRTMFRNRYKHGVKQYEKNVASLIYKLGIKEGKKELCEDNHERMKRHEKALLKFEKMFKKGNNKSIQQINGKYLIEFLKSDEYKLYKKREKNYIEVLERIKEFYKEYKSRLQSPKESGIFNNKDPENPNRFRQYHEGQVITDFMEGYLKNNEQYLKSEGAQTPLVVLKKDNHKNDKIMEKHDRIKDMNVDSAKPIIPPTAATTMPPGAEEYIQGVDEYDLSEMQDEEFRPQTPDYDPETPPPAWAEDSIEPRYDSDYYDDYYNHPYEGGFKDERSVRKKEDFLTGFSNAIAILII